MLLDLSEIILRAGMTALIEVDEPSLPDCEWEFAEPVRGILTLANGGGMIHLSGEFLTRLRQPCRRCLADVEQSVSFDVEEHFAIERLIAPETPPEEGEQFDDVLPSVVHLHRGRPTLDVSELLRQTLELNAPGAPLCDETCRGLCPTCGANLNDGPCACAPAVAAGPFAALAALLDEGELSETSPAPRE